MCRNKHLKTDSYYKLKKKMKFHRNKPFITVHLFILQESSMSNL